MKNVLIFLIGAAAGAGAMYLALRKKVEKEINKALSEIDEDKYGKEENKTTEEPEQKESEPGKRDLTAYHEVLKKVDYTKAAPATEEVTTMTESVEKSVEELTEKAQEIVGKPKAKKTKVPKKVTPDEFDATNDDGKMTLTYYADGVLADDEDNVYDPVETMGATNFKNFKATYDPVYILNYANGIIYEVVQDNRKYSDIVGGDVDF